MTDFEVEDQSRRLLFERDVWINLFESQLADQQLARDEADSLEAVIAKLKADRLRDLRDLKDMLS